MEKEMEGITKREVSNFAERKISRKEAIRRTGYIAASAATMMVLLSKPSQARDGRGGHEGSSCAPPPNQNNHHETYGHNDNHKGARR